VQRRRETKARKGFRAAGLHKDTATTKEFFAGEGARSTGSGQISEAL
jgi:hypothetical protein